MSTSESIRPSRLHSRAMSSVDLDQMKIEENSNDSRTSSRSLQVTQTNQQQLTFERKEEAVQKSSFFKKLNEQKTNEEVQVVTGDTLELEELIKSRNLQERPSLSIVEQLKQDHLHDKRVHQDIIPQSSLKLNNMDRKVEQMLMDKRIKMGAQRSLGNASREEMPL